MSSADPADSLSDDRRAFLARLAGLLAAAVGAALAGAGLTTFLGPAFRRPAAGWVRVGEVDPDLVSAPRPFIVSFRRRDGWYTGTAQGLIFVTKDDAGSLAALSSTCTHLGCGVRWDPAREQFLCPCHGGAYDAAGRVVAGPPPRPLPRLETRLEGGVLFVRGEGIGA